MSWKHHGDRNQAQVNKMHTVLVIPLYATMPSQHCNRTARDEKGQRGCVPLSIHPSVSSCVARPRTRFDLRVFASFLQFAAMHPSLFFQVDHSARLHGRCPLRMLCLSTMLQRSRRARCNDPVSSQDRLCSLHGVDADASSSRSEGGQNKTHACPSCPNHTQTKKAISVG